MNAILKYPGGKNRIVNRILDVFPEHKVYLEPFFGGGAVFFNKKPSEYETINDIDNLVVNFFRACRDYPEALAEKIYLTPFSRAEYMAIQEERAGQNISLSGDCVEDARRFMVRCHQSFGSKLSDRVGWKNTKHSTGPVNPRVWNKLPGIVQEAATRLKNAQIENIDALKLIENYNSADCLIYADPPYPKIVREKRMYRYEMMELQKHEALLNTLINHKGAVVLSSYENDFYNNVLQGWCKLKINTYANSGAERTEVLYMNFDYEVQMKLWGGVEEC